MDGEPAFLGVDDVASDGLPEDFLVPEGIEVVVCYLEGETEVESVVVEVVAVLPGGTGDQCAHLCGAGYQHAGLQPDHADVFIHGDGLPAFELHVVLLPFADLCGRAGKKFHQGRHDFARPPGYARVAVDAHYVSGKDRRVGIPFLPDRVHSAAQRGAVHDVVVDQGEAVEHFQPGGRLQYLWSETVLVE